MPALASLAPRRPPEERQPSNLKRHSPGATPPRAGEVPTGGKEGSLWFEGRGPPGSKARPGAGPWMEGKTQDRRKVTQATLRGKKSREGDRGE